MGRKRGTKRKATSAPKRTKPAQPGSGNIRQTRAQARAMDALTNPNPTNIQSQGPEENASNQTTGRGRKNRRQMQTSIDSNVEDTRNGDFLSVNVSQEERREFENDVGSGSGNLPSQNSQEGSVGTQQMVGPTSNGMLAANIASTNNGVGNSAAGTSDATAGSRIISDLFAGPGLQSQQRANTNKPQEQQGEDFNCYFESHDITGINTNRQALTAVCNPLGEHLPQALKDKIRKGEFVEFGLLVDQKVDNFQPPGGFSLGLNATGQIVVNQSRPQHRITTIHAWTNAFFVFTAIYLRSHPQRAQELLKYGHLLRTAASRFGGWGWRDYDIQFRMRQQSHPQNSWSVIDGELWTLYVAVPPPFSLTSMGGQLKSFRGSISGGARPTAARGAHTGGIQRFSKSAPQSSSGSKSYLPKICFPFNSTGSCSRTDCRFKHRCSVCDKDGHGASTCASR